MIGKILSETLMKDDKARGSKKGVSFTTPPFGPSLINSS